MSHRIDSACTSICPGKDFAYQTVYIAIASMIWALDIGKAKDVNGNVIEPSQDDMVHEGIVM